MGMMKGLKNLRVTMRMDIFMEVMVIKGSLGMFKVNPKGWQVLVECHNNNLYHNTFGRDHKGKYQGQMVLLFQEVGMVYQGDTLEKM